MFDMSLIRPSLTVQLTSGADVLALMCGKKMDTSSNYTVTIFSHMTKCVSVIVNFDTIFRLFFLEITTNSNF